MEAVQPSPGNKGSRASVRPDRKRFGRLRDPAVAVPLLLVLATAALTLVNPAVVDEHVETLLVDLRFRLRNLLLPPPAPLDPVIVAIDEKSLSERGRWPWNRSLQATLMQKVLDCEPAVLSVDIFYPEPESTLHDRALADLLAKHREKVVVALGFEVEPGKRFAGEIPAPLYDMAIPRIEHLRYVWPTDAFRVLLPPEPIASAAQFGHVYSLPDRDGKLRWDALYLRMGDEFFPSLALQTARIAWGLPLEEVRVVGGAGVRVADKLIPTDEFGRIQINYQGREGAFPYVSAADVLAGRVSCSAFRGRIVFIGTSAIATYDLKNTPFSANMPGVEKNATAVANLLAQNQIRQAPLTLNLLVILVFGILLVRMSALASARNTFLIYLLAAVLFTLGTFLVFFFFRWRIHLAYPLFMLAVQSMFLISYRYVTEERRARDIRRIFSTYVTERVVDELIQHPELTRLGGERREVTVLFSDIRDFSAFSEANQPEEVVALLNEFLGAMTEVIFRWEGTLDKFVGDGIMAFWGAPIRQENHAEVAVRCALHMTKRLGELQKSWRSRGKKPLDMGIGINTGEVIVGNIGAEGKKMEYTVIGDAVNLGARTETLTRLYDTNILITEFTYEKIRELVRSRRIGHCYIQGLEIVRVKGKERPVKIFKIRSLEHGTESVILEDPGQEDPPPEAL